MAQPIVHYDGNFVTCYPGSNQTDDGKLNMEFNMTRLVTRVTSKNFCTVKPSYELKQTISNTGKPQIEIGEGQCSINGMDLIMKQKLIIDAPEKPGDYYLIFKLYRDGSNNVKGDDVYGVTRTFMGLYVTYVDNKPDPLNDADVLYIAKLHYDGNEITDLVEDEDKYGRIWAEDILCKIKDSKHPDISRLILQDLIYKLPDWYVSKEGDKEFGEIDFMASRLSEGTYGIHIQAKNDNQAEIIAKAPILLDTEKDRILKAYATNTGVEIDIGKSKLKSNITDNYDLDLQTPNSIIFNSDKDIKLIGKGSVSLGSGLLGGTPKYELKNNSAKVSSNDSELVDEIIISTDKLTHKIGNAVFEYNQNNKQLSLLNENLSEFEIRPNVDMVNNARVQKILYLGSESIYGRETSYLSKDRLQINTPSSSAIILPNNIEVKGSTDGNISAAMSNDSSKATLNNKGVVDLYNNATNTKITFRDGASGYNAEISKTFNASELNLNAKKVKTTGDMTVAGDVRANRVYNAVYNDIVEFMEKSNYDENIDAGDIVFFDENGKVTKWNNNVNIKALAGIVSSEETYGYALGGYGLEENEKVPVALKGRVYVKTKNTEIKTGDMIGINSMGEAIITDSYDNFTLGIATKKVENGKVLVMIK